MSAVAVSNIWEDICKEFAAQRPPFEDVVSSAAPSQSPPASVKSQLFSRNNTVLSARSTGNAASPIRSGNDISADVIHDGQTPIQTPIVSIQTVNDDHTVPDPGGNNMDQLFSSPVVPPTVDETSSHVELTDGQVALPVSVVESDAGNLARDGDGSRARSTDVPPVAGTPVAGTPGAAGTPTVSHSNVDEAGAGDTDQKHASASFSAVQVSTVQSPGPEVVEQPQQKLPPKQTCLPRDYLKYYVFPVLLPALEQMLHAADKQNCFIWKRVAFNSLDFLTEYLYKRNPMFNDRGEIELLDIPFVSSWLEKHPRPPLPKSLVWTEDEATLIIQSFWRGYKVRRETEVQDLRVWQRDWRDENESIKNKVDDFWAKQMPADDGANSPREPEATVENTTTPVATTPKGDSGNDNPDTETVEGVTETNPVETEPKAEVPQETGDDQ